MKFSIDKEQINSLRHGVTLLNKLIPKVGNDVTESCISIKTGTKKITLSTYANDKHYLSLDIPASVSRKGAILIDAKALATLIKNIPNIGRITLSADDNNLYGELTNLGSISESIYSKGTFNKGTLIDEDNEELELGLVLGSSSTIGPNLMFLGNNITGDIPIYVNGVSSTDGSYFNLYGCYTPTGFMRTKDMLGPNKNVSFCIDPYIASVIPSLGLSVEIYIDKTGGVIEFRGDDAFLRTMNKSFDPNYFEAMELIIGSEASAMIEIESDVLSMALKFQSYKTDKSNTLSINFDETLVLKGGANSSSNLPIIRKDGEFHPMKTNLYHTIKALQAIRTKGPIIIEQYDIELDGDNHTKCLSFKPSDKTNGYDTSLVNEEASI